MQKIVDGEWKKKSRTKKIWDGFLRSNARVMTAQTHLKCRKRRVSGKKPATKSRKYKSNERQIDQTMIFVLLVRSTQRPFVTCSPITIRNLWPTNVAFVLNQNKMHRSRRSAKTRVNCHIIRKWFIINSGLTYRFIDKPKRRISRKTAAKTKRTTKHTAKKLRCAYENIACEHLQCDFHVVYSA